MKRFIVIIKEKYYLQSNKKIIISQVQLNKNNKNNKKRTINIIQQLLGKIITMKNRTLWEIHSLYKQITSMKQVAIHTPLSPPE